jgi:hypothetical protein
MGSVANRVVAAGVVSALLCACSSGRPQASAINAERTTPGTQATSARAAEPAEPSAAPPALATSGEPAPLDHGTPLTGASVIEVVLGNETKVLDGPCQQTWRGMKRPYLEVLDPNTASPRVILDACGSQGLYLDIVGNALKLPGPVTPIRLRIMNAQTNEDWVASDVKFEVTEFGAAGSVVRGTFSGTMSPRLNRDAVPIHGKFSVLRAPDRFAP